MTEPLIFADATLRDAIRVIEHTRRLIACCVTGDGRLLGILSDGDIRRALLGGLSLDSPVAPALTRQPIVAPARLPPDELRDFMIRRGVAAVPLVDDSGRLVRVVNSYDFAIKQCSFVGGEAYAAAVIMAGG